MPKRRPQSKGICTYCGASYAKAGMVRHLAGCEKRQANIAEANNNDKGKSKKWFHLIISGEYEKDYWIHLEIDASQTLAVLDQFLRDIWLECCGHLSAFRIDAQTYSVHPMGEYGEKNMGVALKKVLKPDMIFQHEYDFGTTTNLSLKVIAEREGKSKDSLTLMARNEPPLILCEMCHKKSAQQVCSACIYNDPAWFCEDCAPKHNTQIHKSDEYEEDYFLPVVNSPRVGMCGYEGSEKYP